MRSTTLRIAVNGKIFCWPLTGIRRVTEELIIAMDDLLAREPLNDRRLELEIVVPGNYSIDLPLKNIRVKKTGELTSGYFITPPWEQFILPASLDRDKILLNMGNTGPILVTRSVTFIYDAQIFITPESYNGGFRIWHQMITKIIGRRSRKIITISEFSRQQLIKYDIAPAQNIEVIELGCEHILRTSANPQALDKLNLRNKRFALAQARTSVYKNIPMLIEAFSMASMREITLVLYGSSFREDYEKLGVQIPDNVTFAGRVTDGELKALLGSAVATLTPSTTEGFGLQPLEGMIIGCPAIVAPCGAMPEVCQDAVLYAEPHSAKEWSAKIRQLIDDKDLVDSLKQKGLDRARQYSWERAAASLLQVLRSMQ